MISVIGVGTAGINVAHEFSQYPQYNIYKIGDIPSGDKQFKWEYDESTPESIEKNTPNFNKFLDKIDDSVYFIVAGDSILANATLAILEQIKEKNISVFFLNPENNLLPTNKKLQNRAVFSILQEYARSGLFESFNILNNYNYESIIGSLPIKNYWKIINNTIVSSIHMMNVFKFSKPILGKLHNGNKISRIKTFGIVDVNNFEEKLFFKLDNVREKRYYIGINEETLENDTELYSRIVNNVNEKSEGGDIDVSYAIFSTKYEHDLVYCEYSTHFIQS